MRDDELKRVVQSYEELYNPSHPDFKNKQRKKHIWKEIGNFFKMSAKACRKHWKRLRPIQLRKTKSGAAAAKLKPPKLEKELALQAVYHFDEESQHTVLASPTILSNNNESAAGTKIDNDSVRLSVNISASASTHFFCPMLKKRPIETKKVSGEPSASTILEDFLKAEAAQTCSQPLTALDPLTAFFISMATTVKKFPLREQNEIKKKLFYRVNSVEMRIADAQTNPISFLPPTLQMVTTNEINQDLTTHFTHPYNRYDRSLKGDGKKEGVGRM